MEIFQLRYFIMVVKFGNFTKAAKELHITQPALSKQIKCLEEETKVKLLKRTKRGVEITEEGKQLKKHADNILIEVEKINHAIHSKQTI
ncbi:regulatory helix-turn-helix protein, lysR family [Marininema mesophilum]|uniref:Regulatory helix-turn-helix protein, lysR family n=1 Tax=Marininema mesophilum TaxID=1048340 RepID=A0A1H3C473_9BACL|nr:LysR family transcriptional regulator [Marininema mesophilum]SDX48972.1 regulatory helix-turn-helix protein, lysR family [Marininema mesophilum]